MTESMQDLTAYEPPARHRAVASGFAAVAARMPDWDAPSPVPEWRARDVVGHLTGWFPHFLRAGGVELAVTGASVDDDPAAAWSAQSAAVQALLESPDAPTRILDHPYVGRLPLLVAVDRFYTADVFMHTWDLARAAGEQPQLDPAWAGALLDGLHGGGDAARLRSIRPGDARRPGRPGRPPPGGLHRPRPRVGLAPGCREPAKLSGSRNDKNRPRCGSA